MIVAKTIIRPFWSDTNQLLEKVTNTEGEVNGVLIVLALNSTLDYGIYALYVTDYSTLKNESLLAQEHNIRTVATFKIAVRT